MINSSTPQIITEGTQRARRGWSDGDLARAIFMRDHDHLILPARYSERERAAYDAALLRRRWERAAK